MKKRNTTVIFAGLFVLASLLFFGCKNIITPSLSETGGKGNVTVSFSAGRAALLPSVLDFDVYQFVFTNTDDGTTIPETRGKNESFTFSLAMGETYTLEVKAYKGSVEAENLGADGTSDPFTVKAVTNVLVALNGYLTEGVEGTFSYNIMVPDNTVISRFELHLNESDSITLPADITDGVVSNTVSVPAGRYLLILWLSKGNGKTEDYSGVTIYSNAVTYYGTVAQPIVFGNTDFRDPTAPLEWRGFNIAGANHFYNNDRTSTGFNDPNTYDRSRAVGTLYQAFEDPNGTIWQEEVLKLEPPAEKSPSEYRYYEPWPAGAYENWTVTMTYPINAGKYKLSMKVWVEKSKELAQVAWFSTNTWSSWTYAIVGNANPANDIKREEWIDIEGVFTITSTTEICIMARYNGDVCGLRDATIYIRDLVLEPYEGDEPPPDPPDPPDPDEFIISPENITLIAGKTKELYANMEVYSWESSNVYVATVSNGVVTAVSAGTATITATSDEDPPQTATTTVTVLPEGSRRYIALTFDDGPDPVWTPAFLNVLAEKGAHATFFPTGYRAVEYPAEARSVVEAGHDVGNHFYSHNNYSGYDISEIRRLIIQNQIAVEKANGKMPVLFRAPGLQYGTDESPYVEKQYGGRLVEAARSLGLPTIDTSGHQLGNFDWGMYSAEAIFERVKLVARDWGIIILHDGQYSTHQYVLEALPLILDWLSDEGYTVVGLHEMAAIRGIELTPGKIYYDFSEEPPAVPVVRVSGIEVASNVVAFTNTGTSQQISAVVMPVNATVQDKYWYSDNENVATVDASGNVTAVGKGTTNITVIAGSQYAKVKVTVGDVPPDQEGTKTTWAAFDWAGTDDPYERYWGAKAIGEEITYFKPGDEYSYDNVLKLSPPEGGYYAAPGKGSMAMVFNVPSSGTYTLTYDVFVESESTKVSLIWYVSDPGGPGSGWPQLNNDGGAFVETGKWLTRTGSCDIINEGAPFGLLGNNSGNGLQNATIYLKNLTLKLAGAEDLIIDIQSTAIPVEPPASPGVTFEWADGAVPLTVNVSGGGSVVGQESVTVTKDSVVTITAPSFTSYQWLIGRKEVSTENTYTFTATEDCTILLWVDGKSKGASITVIVE